MVSLRQTILLPLLAFAWAGLAQTTTTISLSNAGLNLRGLAFPDGQHGVAVGSAGLAMTSADAGTSFTLLGTGAGNDITALSMVDADRGWAAGRGGLVLVTTDGGQTWADQSPSTTADLLHIFFTDATTGYTVGTNGGAFKTTDGGQSWTAVPTGVATQLNAAYFFNPQNGIVVGNSATMLRTGDGGQTWTSVPLPAGFTGSLLSIYFADALNGWAGATQGRVLRTTDGGASWQLIVSGAGYPIFSFVASGPNQVWASGGSATTGGIIGSTDGGQTWTPAYAFAGRVAVLALSGGQAWAAGDGGLVLRSTDLATWIPVRQPFAGTANAIDFVDNDPDHGWIAGSNGVMLHTADAGQTWTAENTGSGLEMLDVQAIDPATAVAVAGVGQIGGIYRATAGGWSAAVASGPALQGVHFTGVANGWVGGANGALQTTADGGLTWTGQASGTGEALTDIFFLNDQLGWAVGTAGIILKTTDGGASWATVPGPSTGILYGIRFADASTGYIVGSAGTVLKSTDGGDSWVALTVPTTAFLNGLAFTDANEGWVVGNDATILHTDDGGQTWQLLPSPVNVFYWDITIQSISAGSDVVLFATGNNGVVLKVVVSKPTLGHISLQCPTDAVVEALPGQAPVALSGLAPTAGTTCPAGGLSLSDDTPAGGFPIGVTTVTYTAGDACGNSASCSFTVSVGELGSCDTKILDCIRFDVVDVEIGAGGSKRYRLAVRNDCADPVDFVAFQLPFGIAATTPTNNSTYTAPSGRTYKVRNPSFAPYYSIRFRTSDGPQGGDADLFIYELPPGASPLFILAYVRFVSGKSVAAHLNVVDCLPPALVLELQGTEIPALERFIWNHDDRFLAAPNPTGGLVTVSIPTRADYSKALALFDSQGALVQEFVISPGERSRTIDLFDLAKGPYWLRMRLNDGSVESTLLVKE